MLQFGKAVGPDNSKTLKLCLLACTLHAHTKCSPTFVYESRIAPIIILKLLYKYLFKP